jgi:hypothetical protein
MVFSTACNNASAARIFIALIPGDSFNSNIVGLGAASSEYNFS